MWTLVFRGLATGSIYSLTAMGIVLVLSTTNVMNFAQGDMGMFLAFIAFALLMRHVSYPIAIVAVVAVGLLLGALLQILAEREQEIGDIGRVELAATRRETDRQGVQYLDLDAFVDQGVRALD